jgi:hypothetical protein
MSSDLFRAYKGAGNNNFGIVTRLTFQLFPLTSLVFFSIEWNTNDIGVIFQQYQILCQTAPDNLSGFSFLLSSGADNFTIEGVYLGPQEDLDEILNKTLLSVGIPLSVITKNLTFEQFQLLVGAMSPIPQLFPFTKVKSNFFFNEITPEGITEIANFLKTPPVEDITKGICAIQSLSFGGKVNRIPPNQSVVVSREGTIFWLQAGVFYSDQSLEPTFLTYLDNLYSLIKPQSSPFSYYDYPDTQLNNPLFSYFDDFLPFLMRVKKKYNPTNFFNFSQSIPPA